MTLTDFLLARIAEDEAAGRKAADDTYGSEQWSHELWPCDEQGSHVAIDPPRVLAECMAKRRIVERCSAVDYAMPSTHLAHGILAEIALPYADHPDYREEWKP